MLTVLPSPDHVVAFAISGTLTKDDFGRLTDEIDAKLNRHDRIGVMIDLTGFEDVTFKAALDDLRYNLGKLGEWKRFPRQAVVTDKQWIRTLVDFAGGLIPFVTVKVFQPDAQQAALDWAGEFKRPAV
jgi:hypothetical protein